MVARVLHFRLLRMHVVSALGQSAAAAKYLLPASNTSCTVTHRIFVAMVLLFDVSVRILPQQLLVQETIESGDGGVHKLYLLPGVGSARVIFLGVCLDLAWAILTPHSTSSLLRTHEASSFPRAICVRFDTNAGQPEIT